MKILTCICSISILVGQAATSLAEPGQDDATVARVQEASVRWQSACSDSRADESCVVTRSTSKAHSCQTMVVELAAGQRRAARAQRANEALQSALAQLSGEPLDQPVEAIVAEGRYRLAQAALLDFLAIKAPRRLSFDAQHPKRSQRSTRAFLAFIKGAQHAAQEASVALAQVAKLPRNTATQPYRIASLGQQARMYRHFAELLYGMEIPIDVRTGPYAEEGMAAFCDAMADQAGPLEDLAIQSADACIAESENTDSPWRAQCEDWQKPIGSLGDKRVVRRVVHAKTPAFKRCYEKAKIKDSEWAGTLNLKLEINTEGHVHEASASGMDEPALISCVTLAARSLLFPPPLGTETTTIDYPLRFGVAASRQAQRPRSSRRTR